MLDEGIVRTDDIIGAHSAREGIRHRGFFAQHCKPAGITVGKYRPGYQNQDEDEDCDTMRFFSYRHNYIGALMERELEVDEDRPGEETARPGWV